jgi:RNA polymerase sigma factor (sigma-70 family)
VEPVVRIEWARVVAILARYTGDVGLAEELAQDAVVAALEQWPRDGVPSRPGAWLTTVAKRRAIDLFRRNRELEHRYDQLGRDLQIAGAPAGPDPELAAGDEIDDDMLRLIFTACHPVLAVPARVALTLRLLAGLSAAEIARAYLVPEPTIAQRIVRAKKTLTQAGVPFETPDRRQRPARLSSVLVALMEIQSSRLSARAGPDGQPVLLLDQDRTRWDRLLINRGLAALGRAERLAAADPGPYLLQAAIAACHVRAFRAEDTDWNLIAELYTALARLMPSPVVELNRAVALSMAVGPQAGLDLVDQLTAEPSLRDYHLLASVRGDLLMKLGRPAEAHAAFERAAALTRNGPERALTLARAREAEAEAVRAKAAREAGAAGS